MFKNEMLKCVNIKKPIIWVKTFEEKEALMAIKNVLDETEEFDNLYMWSNSIGVEKIFVSGSKVVTEQEAGIGLDRLTSKIKEYEDTDSLETAAFILRDYHMLSSNPNAIRSLRDIVEAKREKFNAIIILSPSDSVPFELSKVTQVIDYTDPTAEEIFELIRKYAFMKRIEIDNIEHLSSLFVGFTRKEIIDTLSLSLLNHGSINVNEIANKKIEVIKRTGVLDYKEPRATLEEVGGNEFFKKWIEEAEYCMDDEAPSYGVSKPKGHLALGIPGTSKTYTAEALAGRWQVPFLKLTMDKILSKYAGESEQNIAKALQLIESCAPCVLLIDEVEKALGGIKSSNSSDSGVVARTFGKILEFLNDNDKGVYVIMTSNDVSQLPPELTRAGRLDAIWYFGLPDDKEREEIFKVHFKKANQTMGKFILDEAVKQTKNYTGAEIEQVVKVALKKSFIRFKKEGTSFAVTKEDIVAAKEQVVPIFESSKEKINQLELWTKGRALYANKREKKMKLDINTDII